MHECKRRAEMTIYLNASFFSCCPRKSQSAYLSIPYIKRLQISHKSDNVVVMFSRRDDVCTSNNRTHAHLHLEHCECRQAGRWDNRALVWHKTIRLSVTVPHHTEVTVLTIFKCLLFLQQNSHLK